MPSHDTISSSHTLTFPHLPTLPFLLPSLSLPPSLNACEQVCSFLIERPRLWVARSSLIRMNLLLKC